MGLKVDFVKDRTEGAWVTGLVLADEHPRSEDANANGIDDAFERKARGVALTGHATLAERRQLAQEWKEAQRVALSPAWWGARPMPDRPVVGKWVTGWQA